MDKSDWKLKQYDLYSSAIDRIQSRGVSVDGCFILGLDSDDPGVFEKTRDFIEKSRLLEAQITILTPFPGTRLHQRLKKENRLLKEAYWDRCTLFDINFVPRNMSVQQLEDGLAWLGSEIYSEGAFNRRKEHYKQVVHKLV
jgi:radical SAM superfamily enzyme YgiQ (UPF0313 family)